MISRRNMSKSRKFETQLYDSRISRIEKEIAKNRPKSLDLYASIYGNSAAVKKVVNAILAIAVLGDFSIGIFF
jgi:hypothetical protein